MSRARDLADSADKDIVGTLTVDGITVDGTADATTVEFDNLSGTGAISVTDILDQDDMSSDSATALATQQSIKAYVDTEVAGIVDSAPAALDTLNELAAALGDDVNFSTTVTNSIATKLPLAGGTLSGALDVNATVTADKVDIGNGVAGGTSEILFSDNVSSRGKIIYDHSSNPETLVLQTTGTTALSIDNSQNISIPTGDLTIGSGQADAVILELSNTDSVSNGLQIQLSGNGKDVYFWNHENAATAFATNNIQRMTISSGGDVLFGTTDTSPANNSANGTADNGTVIGGGLVMSAAYKSSANAGAVGYFNRTGTDGDIVQLFKSGVAVGGIGTNGSAPYLTTAVGSTLCGIKAQGGSTPRILPTDGDGAASNGVTDLGGSTERFKDLFIGNDIGHLDNGGTARLLYDRSANLLGNTGTNVTCATLSKSSGSFKIDHPLEAKTATHHLIHSFVESPTADNIYRGKIALVSGSATVNIDTVAGMTDGTFAALNREVQCFTSNESGWTAVKGSVSGNTLTITAQEDTCTDTVSWLVVGERQDPHMYATDWTDENGKVIVEPLKPVIEETEEETP